MPVGLLMNFNVAHLRNGLRRLSAEGPHMKRPSRPLVLPVK
ncbi:MAG: hypothetical protein AB1824_11935 [Acidobacteriota bacterium]